MRTPDFTHEDVVARRPHHVAPSVASAHIILVSELMGQPKPAGSAAGLDVTVNNTAKVLRRAGVQVDIWTVRDAGELIQKLEVADWRTRPITHVIVNNPRFIPPDKFAEMAGKRGDVEFVQLNHSGLAYLSIDDWGVFNIKAVLDLETALHNVRVAVNNPRNQRWLNGNFGVNALLLPNLYDTESFRNPIPSRSNHDPLRVGSFGAGRPWKNPEIAVEAAMTMARRLGVNLELYVNSGHWDTGGKQAAARDQLLLDVPWAKVIQIGWQVWPKFRRTVAAMDILLSPSFDETFCVVCADGIAEGVPSVVTGAMEWTPQTWWAQQPWDQESVAFVGMALLHDTPGAIHAGRQALTEYVESGTRKWVEYLCR